MVKPRKPVHGEVWLLRNGRKVLMLEATLGDSMELITPALRIGADKSVSGYCSWTNVGSYDEHGGKRGEGLLAEAGADFGAGCSDLPDWDCMALMGSAIRIDYVVNWQPRTRRMRGRPPESQQQRKRRRLRRARTAPKGGR